MWSANTQMHHSAVKFGYVAKCQIPLWDGRRTDIPVRES